MTVELVDVKINVKIKLAALWLTVNLLILYQDVYTFYKPGVIEGAIAEKYGNFKLLKHICWEFLYYRLYRA